jgi:hypothetical protein
VKVKDAAAGIEPAGGGVASDIGAALFTVLFSHHATEDIKRLRERFVKWVKGPAPEKNQDLERALARCQILADLLCLMEATPWGIEGEHDSWLRRVAGRLPPSLNAGGGIFQSCRRRADLVCKARLKAAEEDFEVSKIDMSKLLKREINGDFGRSLGLEAIAELESMETNSGARIGAL